MKRIDCLDETRILKLAGTDKPAVLEALSSCLAERAGLEESGTSHHEPISPDGTKPPREDELPPMRGSSSD
jgi:hypothetical protein